MHTDTAIDDLCRRKYLECLDVLVQRRQAEEASIADGGWANAQWMELLPRVEVSMADDGERNLTAKEREKEQKRMKLVSENSARASVRPPTGLGRAEPGTGDGGASPGGGSHVKGKAWWDDRKKQ